MQTSGWFQRELQMFPEWSQQWDYIIKIYFEWIITWSHLATVHELDKSRIWEGVVNIIFNPMADESINSLPKNLEQDNMKDMAAMLQEYTVKGVAYYYVLGVVAWGEFQIPVEGRRCRQLFYSVQGFVIILLEG